MSRIEMLHEDKCHPIIGWQSIKQLGAGLEAASRGAYADDGKVRRPMGGPTTRRKAFRP